ncbi:MAG: response regulator transcription factor [Saprospiraceae bacterium]|nr:response regulator transcription factor [Saprospiraceae bacterium]
MIKVLIVDDHQIVIDGMMSLLADAENITCQGFANSGQEALNKLQEKSYDLVLLDINMPEMDGLKTCNLILQQHPTIKVIALTMLAERSMIRAMVETGAKGYLLKNVGHDELVTAIRRVHSGKSHYSSEIADILLSPLPKAKNKPQISLSSREKQILQLIVDEFTTSEISEKLFISVNTVETHRRNIMNKLGAKNTAGVVRIALENKLL